MKRVRRTTLRAIVLACVGVIIVLIVVVFFITRIKNGVSSLNEGSQLNLNSEPVLSYAPLSEKFSSPVSIVFPNQDTMLIGEKSGEIKALIIPTSASWTLGEVPEVLTEGERGLQALEIDREFYDNRYVYACYNALSPDRGIETRVSRFKLSSDFKSLVDRLDIVTGITNTTALNQGCELAMDRLGYLWVAVGDSGSPTAAQDPQSLGGKVLRVLRDGNPVSANQALPFDPRIYSYGHRNPQGLTLLDAPLLNGAYGYLTERGGVEDDEVNELIMGNFGWDPNNQGSYNNSAPMTDLRKYSNAIRSLWSSGRPVNEVTDVERLGRKRWQAWQNRLIVTAKRPGSTLLIELASDGSYKSEKPVFEQYPSIGLAVEGPDGNLYLGTSNGGNDEIIQIRVLCTVCD